MCPQDCSKERIDSIKDFYLVFFGPWAGNLSKSNRFYSGDLSKMLSMPAEELLGERQNLRRIWSVLAQNLGSNVNFEL